MNQPHQKLSIWCFSSATFVFWESEKERRKESLLRSEFGPKAHSGSWVELSASRPGCLERLLTQQEQLHLSGRLFSIFPQVFIDHFRPLGRGFIFLTNRAAHRSQCSLQVCSLVGKYHPRKKIINGQVREALLLKKTRAEVERRLPFLTSASRRDGLRSSANREVNLGCRGSGSPGEPLAARSVAGEPRFNFFLGH